MIHQNREAGALTLASICVVLVIISTLAVTSFIPTQLGSPSVDLEVTNVSVAEPGQGTPTISFDIKNVGSVPLNLSAGLAGIASNTTFSRLTVPPGGTSSGRLLVSKVGDFDGANSSLSIENSSSLNFPQFTIEFGFEYANLLPDKQMILDKGSSGPNAFYFYSFRSVNNINDLAVYANGKRADFQLGDIFRVGAWNDLAYTVGTQQIVAYLDGTAIVSWARPAFSFPGNLDPIQIGDCICGGYFFNGSLSTLDYYSTALSPGEIESNYLQPSSPVEADLQFALSLAGTEGGNVPDLSGHGHDGISSNVTFTSPLSLGSMWTLTVTGTTPEGVVFPVSASIPLTTSS
ncbi:MAG: LamG-like jellyroll fold domain-containing protein [Thermoplasmata archaeon]